MSVRLPRIDWAIAQPLKEHEWLPRLAPHLSLAIPMPLALGEPGEGYPWRWSVCTWLRGDIATPDHLRDPHEVAEDLARFMLELRAIDVHGAPPPDGRGEPLATRDQAMRASTAQLGDAIDALGPGEWEAALSAPVGRVRRLDPRRPRRRNLLATDGRLSGVLDFGALAVGDPAADVMVAWKMFAGDARVNFRRILDVDDGTWSRARGWALSQAVMILSYYTLETNRILVLEAERWMRDLLDDPR
jgi:aminoglycoside phosphotransferase (APT) family kinase protein